MESPFTVQLFDLLVYLLPGGIFLLAIFLLFGKKFSVKTTATETKFAIVYVLLFSFFAGVLIHIVSDSGMYVYRYVFNSNYIHEVMNEFEDRERVRKIVSEKLHASVQGEDGNYHDALTYRYAEIVVHEKAPYHSASISRLTALSIFCRNSMIPIVVLLVALLFRFQKERQLRHWLMLVIILLAFEGLLIRGMNNYRETSANMVLRTFLTLYADS
ncbi:MAG: hypothetical protein WA584_19260 [Pyrinomonadaceae bacterium]